MLRRDHPPVQLIRCKLSAYFHQYLPNSENTCEKAQHLNLLHWLQEAFTTSMFTISIYKDPIKPPYLTYFFCVGISEQGHDVLTTTYKASLIFIQRRILIKSLADTRPPALSADILYMTSVFSSTTINVCKKRSISCNIKWIITWRTLFPSVIYV